MNSSFICFFFRLLKSVDVKTSWPYVETHPRVRPIGNHVKMDLNMQLTLSAIFVKSMETISVLLLQVIIRTLFIFSLFTQQHRPS